MFFFNKFSLIFLLLLLIKSIYAQDAASESTLFPGIISGNNCFIENQGQIVSMENKTKLPEILFHTNGNSSDIYIKKNSISYVFSKVELPKTNENNFFASHLMDSVKVEWERIDMELIGANPNPKIIKEDITDYYENFYLSQCSSGIIKVNGNKKITFKDIYPNIDWIVYFTNNGLLKYDFIVHPEGNPASIKIQYKWANNPVLNNDGSITISGPIGEITEGQIIANQGNISIPSSWRISSGNILSFDIKTYDRKTDLIIDPILQWATYYGGTANDMGYSIRSDGTSVFVAGTVVSGDFPTQNPGGSIYFDGSYAGGNDAFIMKFDINGVRQWATYYGGSGEEKIPSISLNTNNVFMTGQTTSNNFPIFNPGTGAYVDSTLVTSTSDVYIVEFDKTGIRQWSTYFGGNEWESGNSIFSTDNFLYISIFTFSNDLPIFNPGGGAYIQSSFATPASSDYYILKMTAAGVPVWGTYFGGSNIEAEFEVIFEFNGDIYLAGGSTSTSADFPLLDPLDGLSYFQGNNAGGTDITIAKFNSAGVLTWSTFLGGTGDETVRTYGANNNKLWIGGVTSSPTLTIPTVDPGGEAYYKGTYNGANDGFLASFNTSNQYIWGTYFGGTAADYINSIHADNNSLWISGKTLSTPTATPAFPLRNPGMGTFYQGTRGSAAIEDAFIAKFKQSTDTLQWSTYYGGNGKDEPTSIFSDNTNLWVTGYSASSNLFASNLLLDPGNGAYFWPTRTGGNEVIILKFDVCIKPNVTISPASDIICLFDTTTLVASGALSYQWQMPLVANDTLIVSPMVDSTYTVIGTDDMTCQNTANVFVHVNPLPQLMITPADSICFGDSITLHLTSNMPSYYLWAPSLTTDSTITVYPDTVNHTFTYFVLVTDTLNGCRNATSTTIYVNPLPGLTISLPDSICLGDSIKLNVSSNLPSWYLWAPGTGTDSSFVVYPDTVHHTFQYTVIVTDTVNGCKNYDTTSVFVHALPQLIITQPDSICKGDTISLYVSSDLPSTYLWTPTLATDSTIAVYPDTVHHTYTYLVLATDTMYGCKNSASTTVFVNALPQLIITSPDSICNKDSIILSVLSDLPSYYLWSPGNGLDSTASTFTVLPNIENQTFNYNVLVTDTVNGCKNNASTSIYVNPLPVLSISLPDSICLGDSITLNVSSNVPSWYLWLPGNGTDSSFVVSPDTVHHTFQYIVLVTDTVYGCKNYDTTTVFIHALPQLIITQPDSICKGDTIALNVSSDLPSTYLWTPGNGTDSTFLVSPGNSNQLYLYNVLVTDTVNGCKNDTSTTVFINALPQLLLTPPDSICNRDSITLSVISDLPSYYLWSPGNGLDSTSSTFIVHPDIEYQTFIYSVLATDTVNGCRNIASTSVFVHGKPNILISGAHPICAYDSITISALSLDTIHVSYEWIPGMQTDSSITFFPNFPDSTYQHSVIVTSVYHCKDTASALIVVHPSISVNITPTDTAICYLDSITLHAHATFVGNTGNTFEWSGPDVNSNLPNITFSPDSNGTYTLIGTTTEQCKDTASVNITVYSLPNFVVTGSREMCFGDSVVMTATTIPPNNTNIFSWSPYSGPNSSTVTLFPNSTTTFQVTGTDTNTCHSTKSFNIIVYPLPVASISGINRICFEDQTILTASNSTISGDTHYLWNTNDTTISINVSPPNTSIYTVIAFQNICSDTTTYQVIVDPKPILTLTPDTTLIIGMSVPLHVTGANDYVWNPIDYLSCYTCSDPVAKPYTTIEYCVIGTNTFGCSDTACVVVTIDAECGEVFVPSAFSPNGDSQNDVLYVYGKCVKWMEFKVYNRWGEKVFESSDPEIGWDGKFRGKESDTDVFVYILKAEYYNGQKVESKGNITLMH